MMVLPNCHEILLTQLQRTFELTEEIRFPTLDQITYYSFQCRLFNARRLLGQ